jgi:hypothetical protein
MHKKLTAAAIGVLIASSKAGAGEPDLLGTWAITEKPVADKSFCNQKLSAAVSQWLLVVNGEEVSVEVLSSASVFKKLSGVIKNGTIRVSGQRPDIFNPYAPRPCGGYLYDSAKYFSDFWDTTNAVLSVAGDGRLVGTKYVITHTKDGTCVAAYEVEAKKL